MSKTIDAPARGLDNIPFKKGDLKKHFINQTKGVSMLGVEDLKDALLSLCDFANDINNKSGLLGFADNLPGLLAAFTGYENILPQAADVDEVEKAELVNAVKERLELTEGAEEIVGKGLNVLWSIGELYKSIKAVQPEKEG